jgi:Mlc titration factor MtfA (ptsG expression regulator)
MEQELSPFEIAAAVIFALFFIGAALSFFFGILIIQLEHAYAGLFNRPFYVHLYPFPKPLDSGRQFLLRQHSAFYARLSSRHKRYFEHRMVRFLEHYTFIGREDFAVTDDVRVRIAAIYVMMTFGMRRYLVAVFDKIIVYPDIYESAITGEHHKGEFNPRHKAVVFSWPDFVAGQEHSADNINLGIHEFSHVLHYHGTKSPDISSKIFLDAFERIRKEVHHPKNRQALLDSGYFRDYAYENAFEFVAVILEHYFETPEEFESKFPRLYGHVSRMLNHKHIRRWSAL